MPAALPQNGPRRAGLATSAARFPVLSLVAGAAGKTGQAAGVEHFMRNAALPTMYAE